MASMFMSFLLATLFLASTTLSLQVSSNSPCTSLCLENPAQNATSLDDTNTFGSDITCVDKDYAGTPNGQRFMACVICLQNSTASDANGSDQEWFLYNLRFALDSCLFGFQQPSDFVTSPCATSESCRLLQPAVEDGNLLPSNETGFSYCSADNNAILGTSLNRCRECLSNSPDEKYLRNFLTALQAGCVQRPGTGTIIGLDGNIFSTTPVNTTFAGYQQSTANATHKGGLPQAAIIGIAVGLAVLLLLAIAIIFMYARKRKNLDSLKSPLDSRFGAINITAPTNGAYGNPYSQPQVSVNEPFDPSKFTAKELSALDSARDVLEKHHSSPRAMNPPGGGWLDGAHARLAGQLNNQTGAAIPTHQAYKLNAFSPVSPTASDTTSDTYQMRDYPSARSSPKNSPAPLILESKPPMHKKSPSAQSQTQIPQMRANNSPQVFPSSPPKHEFCPDPQATTRYEPRNRSRSRPRGESRTREDSRSRDDGRSQGMEDSSRVSPPGLHSQRMAFITDNDQNPPRSNSRADNYKRTTVRPGIENTNASADRPLVKNGGRFDFELAERERKEKEMVEGLASITKDSFKKKKARPEEAMPINTESDEQWPGTY
ncbi:hypothetical protein F5882DRAFT_186454 [Hyaloscypha sp. PMI_1271]|nr:hypothetical protein F5882DRAFT_186454 [Hyaloscypha sp. PMI_1271]